MSNNGIDHPAMEAARTAQKNWTMLREVVSLLFAFSCLNGYK